MNQFDVTRMVEQFIRNTPVGEDQVKVVRVQDSKTVHVETIDEIGRSIVFNEYKVDGKIYWAGYSSRSNTLFISEASGR